MKIAHWKSEPIFVLVVLREPNFEGIEPVREDSLALAMGHGHGKYAQ